MGSVLLYASRVCLTLASGLGRRTGRATILPSAEETVGNASGPVNRLAGMVRQQGWRHLARWLAMVGSYVRNAMVGSSAREACGIPAGPLETYAVPWAWYDAAWFPGWPSFEAGIMADRSASQPVGAGKRDERSSSQ